MSDSITDKVERPGEEQPREDYTPLIVLAVILGAFTLGLLILTFSLYFG